MQEGTSHSGLTRRKFLGLATAAAVAGGGIIGECQSVFGTAGNRDKCTTGNERRITRWKHEHLLEAMQQRLDENPGRMRQRRETVEHPFGTIKSWMGYTHFQMKTLKNVATEMALHVLAYSSSNPEKKGEWRAIELSIEGRPRLEVVARDGYFATP